MNKMNRANLIMILSILFFTSCEEDLQVLSQNKDKIVFECELKAYQQIVAKAYLVNDFNEIDRSKIADDLTIRMTTGIDEEISFTYDSENNYYFVNKSLHVPIPGRSYKVSILNNENNISTTSNTTLKDGGSISGVLSRQVSQVVYENGKGRTFQVTATFNSNQNDHYIRLQAYRRAKNGKLELLKFDGNDEEPLAFHTSEIDGCILADLSRVDKNKFTLNFSTFGPIKNSEILDKVIFVTETISEPAYRYSLSKSKQYNAFNNGSYIPVVSYSNMINGYGFFGSSSAKLDSIEFN
jgi:hypothetical protein